MQTMDFHYQALASGVAQHAEERRTEIAKEKLEKANAQWLLVAWLGCVFSFANAWGLARGQYPVILGIAGEFFLLFAALAYLLLGGQFWGTLFLGREMDGNHRRVCSWVGHGGGVSVNTCVDAVLGHECRVTIFGWWALWWIVLWAQPRVVAACSFGRLGVECIWSWQLLTTISTTVHIWFLFFERHWIKISVLILLTLLEACYLILY